MAEALEPGRSRRMAAALESEIYCGDVLIGRSPLTPAMIQLDGLLKKIKSDRSALLATNLGDFLNGHDSKVLDKDAILKVIVERLQDPADPSILSSKVNELDSTGTPLLHRPIEQGQVRRVALLLASGADPDIKSTSNEPLTAWDVLLRHGPRLSPRAFQQIRDLLDFRTFCCRHPDHCVSIASFPWSQWHGDPIAYTWASIGQLQRGLTPGISLADPRAEFSTWIHVPSTNGLTLLAIFRAIQERIPLADAMRMNFDMSSFFYTYFQPPAVAPGDPFLNYREASYWSGKIGLGKIVHKDNPRCSAIVFPCLALNSVQPQNAARDSYEETRNASSTNTLGSYSADCTVHLERTLDEVYYPGLVADDLAKRNDDQVVSRKFRNQELPDEGIPILMVPQLWLWRVGGFVISAYSMTRESAVYRPWEYGSGEQKGAEWKPRLETPYTDFQLGLIIASHIESFGKESTVGGIRFLPALDIFENEVISVLSDVNKYIDNTKPSSVHYKKERKFLHTLSDIRSELVMILHVLEQQEKVLNDLLNDTSRDDPEQLKDKIPDSWPRPQWDYLERARSSLTRYEQRIKKIDGDAERIEKAVQDMLELKRTYASIKDAHSSLLLSTAVIGFTVITIVFAPLAFLTALFALKIDGFEKLQLKGTDSVYKSGYVGGIFVSSEFLTIALTLVAVKASLWYIKRWDRLEEEDMKKEIAGSGNSKPRSGKAVSTRPGGQTDLESQRVGNGITVKAEK